MSGVALRGTGAEPPAGGGDEHPAATLLPALDPTPMGFRHKDGLTGIDRRLIFDRAGNIGPTLWWDGEIVGSWAIAAGGEIRTRQLADRGAEARDAIERAAARLQRRLAGTGGTPAIRTPLERALTRPSAPN